MKRLVIKSHCACISVDLWGTFYGVRRVAFVAINDTIDSLLSHEFPGKRAKKGAELTRTSRLEFC